MRTHDRFFAHSVSSGPFWLCNVRDSCTCLLNTLAPPSNIKWLVQIVLYILSTVSYHLSKELKTTPAMERSWVNDVTGPSQ